MIPMDVDISCSIFGCDGSVDRMKISPRQFVIGSLSEAYRRG
jgi:hypothetical protein